MTVRENVSLKIKQLLERIGKKLLSSRYRAITLAAGFRGILQLIVSDGACLMIATDGDVDYRVRRSNRVTNLLRG